jgi:hypothetical protein
MVTGCEPDRTGVGQNQPPQPGVPKARRVWYWERKHIRVPTLFDAVKEAGGRSCSILWPVGCRNPAVCWCFPEVHPLEGENTALKALRYGSPLYILHGEKRFGSMRRGIAEPYLSDYAAALAADTIRRRRPDFTALHLIDLDEARHHHGTFSPEADAAVARNSRRLEDLQVGDCLLQVGKHARLVTNIAYDKAGGITGIEISEATPSVADNCCARRRWFRGDGLATFRNAYLNNSRIVRAVPGEAGRSQVIFLSGRTLAVQLSLRRLQTKIDSARRLLYDNIHAMKVELEKAESNLRRLQRKERDRQ